ncbi:hypothetical protein [Cyclobacterium jeungdonense]|uniref:Uncharacterized protein n=1 Tax=Cyclobacterium jeungdonense TaxID=708087 RepID=A0ABT8CBR6_9BACT|nr:hypothetical protein [Cyclobacterium jeungdonense]MDN3689023.1 hypothetical protein [Cyclobacterium jeungdonense]
MGLLFCVFSIEASFGQSEAGGVIAGEQVNEVSYHPQTPEKRLDKSSGKSEKRSFSGYSKNENGSERSDYQGISDKGTQNGEASSEEVSTLSFNIFLYVLDRFKED